MDLREFKEKTAPLVVREDFSEGRTRFQIELRLCDKRELELMIQRCSKRVVDRKTRTRDTEVDTVAFRRELRRLIMGWQGLTWRKLCALTGVQFTGNGASGIDLDGDVPVTDDFKLFLLESVFDFDNWIVEQLTRAGDELAERLEAEKKASGSSSAGS